MKKLFIIGFSILCFSSYSQNDWELIYGSNSSLTLSNVVITDMNHTWGINKGSVYFSPDCGHSWSLQFQNPEYNFNGIFFTNSLTGWVAGWPEVLKTSDGGQNWNLQTLPNPLGLDVEDVFFINQDTGWIAGSYKTIYATYDGGENWISVHDYELSNNYFLYDIHFHDAMHGCAVGGGMQSQQPIILTTNDGGENWTELLLDSYGELVSVQFINDSLVWACSRNGTLFKSTDGGFTWEEYLHWAILNSRQMYFFDENKAIIGGSFRQMITEDGWQTYDTVEFGMYDAVNRFAFADHEHGLAVGNNNFLVTSDGGYNWARINNRFSRIAFFDQMNGWIIPEQMNNYLLHSNDGGSTWNEVQTDHEGSLVEMSFPDNLVGYVATTSSQLLKTTNGGGNWEIIDLPFEGFFPTDMQFLDQNTGFICEYPNTVIKTIDGGLTWEAHQVDTLSSLTACDFINPMEGWVVGWDGVCGKTTDGGQSWTFVNLGEEDLKEIKFLDRNNGIITSQFRIFRTSDGGNNWQQLDMFLNQPQNIEINDSQNGWLTDRANVYRTYNGGWDWVDSLNMESENYSDELSDFFLMDTTHAWICTMDGRVFTLALFQGTDEIKSTESISIYPNPVTDNLAININVEIEGDLWVRLFSVDGKLLIERILPADQNITIFIDVANLPQGVYLVQVRGGQIVQNSKLVKR
jgi:photosystem II stability/assembly factor-like uncharacterized protein